MCADKLDEYQQLKVLKQWQAVDVLGERKKLLVISEQGTTSRKRKYSP